MVDVSWINSEAPDELFVRRIIEEIARRTPKRGWNNKKVKIEAAGTDIQHNLGYAPKHVTIIPLSEMTVWYHLPPDGRYLHLKADVGGDVLISLSGE